MNLLTDDVLLGSAVDASAIAPLEEEIKGDRILSYGLDTRSASQLGASSSFISTFDGLRGQVGTIDPSAKFTQIASTFSFSDIAVSKDGTIFGITPTQLFKIDPVSGLTSYVGDLGAGVVNINALEFANDVLYAAGNSNLYTINTSNGAASFAANLGPGFTSSGDLVFDAANNRFLATSRGDTSDSLFAVSLTGQATKIGDIGINNVWALLFEGGKLFGFTGDGKRIAIDPATGRGAVDSNITGVNTQIGGASGIQIKKGEILSSTPGTILSADTIDVFLPPGGEITLDITVTVPGDASSSTTRSALSVESVDTVAALMPSSSAVSASATNDQLPLDVFLLQDASNSFNDDVSTFQRLVPNLVDTLSNQQPNTQFGLGSFVDKPIEGIGNIEDGHYVYRTNLALTQNENELQSAVNNLTILPGNAQEPEASLEALLQTARRAGTSEIGFRDSARRVVVVATDAPFYQAGDGGIQAGITRPNNGDAVLDGNPPGTGEDYPSIQQVREALIDAGIVPIFAVTSISEIDKVNNISVYNDLVNKLGFGKVVRLDSDSANLVSAITEGLDRVSQEITLVPADDDFNYVKDISPKKFENVKPGDQLNFKVTLKSDSAGGDDNLKLQIPGFGNLGDTKINVRTDRVPTSVNNPAAVIQGSVTGDFKLSPDDFLLQQNLVATAGGLLGGAIGVTFVNPLAGLTAAVGAAYAVPKLGEGAGSFPYGVLGRTKFEITDPDNPSQLKMVDLRDIRDPSSPQPKPGDSTTSERQIELKLFSPTDKQPSPFESETETGKTWVVIHGWNDGPTGNLRQLAAALANVRPNDRVYFLNWEQASVNGRISNDDTNPVDPSLRVGNYLAAKWIRPVAEFVVTKLLKELKIDSVAASKSLNLIGHSLGSLVSGEIGRLYKEGFKDDQGNEIKPNGVGVSTITALDPPSESNIDLLSLAGVDYDLDGRNTQADSPNKFSEVSNYSLALVGARSLAGNQQLAATADESFQINFGSTLDFSSEHGQVVQTFTKLLNQDIKDQQLGLIQQEIIKDRILTERERFKARSDSYSPGHEGVMAVKATDQPIFLATKDINSANDEIIYGSIDNNIGDRKLDGSNILFGLGTGNPIFTGSGNDKIFGDAGNDEINGDSGDDTLDGGAGNDTLIGGNGLFDSGKDVLEGGEGNDLITGGGDKDILTGGTGSDRLDGGNDDDVLFGGLDKDQDTLIGGLGRSLFLLAPGTGLPITDQANLDKVDIIEDFRAGFLPDGIGGDIRGISAIGLLNGLNPAQIEVEKLGDFFNRKTAIIANGQYFAVLKGEWFTQGDLRLTEIPT
ncbi:VWA domain-containing protein [Microcoleus sp. MON2_D5]|uniref:VWA domain-containing protein n=1 Tax=Microcoleus sp. MON2_D5 TaxID=2818833 RepID=UPI002FCE8877